MPKPALRQQEVFGEGAACANAELGEKEKQFRQFSKHQIQLEDNCSPPTGQCPPLPPRAGLHASHGITQWSSHHPSSPGVVGTVHKLHKVSLGCFTSSSLLDSRASVFSAGRKGEGPPCP
ncbi:hypothetical protein DUI87_33422 [Hirundo rustica rustica]|uniref:Uncharacterized protein n=1 Tax=Hirundo rustica rustica TaxID=333673 RepID=A0A3M0IUH4_HIRRU|nr:hypothetical protein DUI87_33422 [Hirundo rustica rustica]